MAVNSKRSYATTGTKEAIPLNRHGNPQFSISVQLSGTTTYTMQGTISQINRNGGATVWNDLPTMTGLTANAFSKVENSPLEALRINILSTTAEVDLQVMQNT